MSKKKSYMNSNNILSENAVYNFLKGLIGKKPSSKEISKLRNDLKSVVKKSNASTERLEKILSKKYNKKIKLKKVNVDDVIKQAEHK